MVPASIPSPDPSWAQFNLGPLTIHTYALCILLGIVAAVIIAQRRLAKVGVHPDVVVDITIWAVPLGIIGARFYHVFTHTGDYFYPGSNPWSIFAIWDGGNALYGSPRSAARSLPVTGAALLSPVASKPSKRRPPLPAVESKSTRATSWVQTTTA